MRAVALVLFLCLFAAQAAVIALSPVLGAVAADLDVSTAAAGQLRTISGLAAAAAALAVPLVSRRVGLRTLLLAGAVVTALASLGSAAAPDFAWLAVAQVAVGIGVATLVAAGTAAAAAWVPEERRSHVLSWTLIGQPTAWVVGMPAIGALGERSWRLGWLALPLLASAAAAMLLLRRPPDAPRGSLDVRLREAFDDPAMARWAIAELLANCGWTGILVYAGAVFSESYGTSAALTGFLLAFGAVAYIAGNMTSRRLTRHDPRPLLILLALLLAAAVPLFAAVRPHVAASALFFSAAAVIAGGRTLIGNAAGLSFAPRNRVAAMGVRTAAVQFGYFAGSGAAGIALAAGGYAALGFTLGSFFVASALTLAGADLRARVLVAQPRAAT